MPEYATWPPPPEPDDRRETVHVRRDDGRYFYAFPNGSIGSFPYGGDEVDHANYWIGNMHATAEAAKEWHAKYGKAFEVRS